MENKKKKLLIKFSIAGLLVPVIFTLINLYFEHIKPFPTEVDIKIHNMALILWPACILLFTDSYIILIISIILNIIFYRILGFFLWRSIYEKKRLFFIPLIILIGLTICLQQLIK
jgi:Zn-dependent protease with chaperone function